MGAWGTGFWQNDVALDVKEDFRKYFKYGITDEEYNSPNVQQIVIEAWKELFKGTEYKPIDIHTPLWLWSRNGFKEVL